MPKTILITGGAGFIGSALARHLLAQGDHVVVLDALHPQVHTTFGRPAGLPEAAVLLTGDVSHEVDCRAALRLVRPDVIVHLAAETGTGQSLTQATRHGRVNVVGTTQLLDVLLENDAVPEHLVLASSRAVYGEGEWEADGHRFYPGPRSHEDLVARRWSPRGPDGRPARHLPSRVDTTVPHPTSVYGATKLAQEHIIGAWTAATGSALSILRLQNVYGPGQSLTNPYTGVLSLFARLAADHQSIEVFEDGEIVRDFVFIGDVIRALAAAINSPPPTRRRTIDIGSGTATTIGAVAATLANLTGAPPPIITGKFRDGDVRCASCDVATSLADLGVAPTVDVTSGLMALLAWVGTPPTAMVS